MTTTPRKNNGAPKSLTLQEIAKLVDGELVGDRALVITGVAGIKEAEKGDITFLSNAKYLPFLSETQASAVITSPEVEAAGKSLVRAANPSAAFSKVVAHFLPPESVKPGVHPTAVIEEGVRLGKDVFIGAHVFIGAGASIGDHTRLYPNVVIRERVELGKRVTIHSGSVIGSDGFGYELNDGKHMKIPQLGSVLIEDDVEIGANVCVDRGRFKNTVVRKGSKIDNLVQIAHNVVIGEDCIIVSQVGISGSTELGKGVVVAGQAGIVGHVSIGDEAVICARSGVSKSVPPKSIVLGEPARPLTEQKKLFALIARLPEMFKDLSELKKKFL